MTLVEPTQDQGFIPKTTNTKEALLLALFQLGKADVDELIDFLPHFTETRITHGVRLLYTRGLLIREKKENISWGEKHYLYFLNKEKAREFLTREKKTIEI
ncbi:MAG: hypothetical protein GF308_11620 [Candidatus Heimdallarchaeota archaeon]|nr:hypothetical protein [Candidatus Heimdallarchaeota archaeon]